MSPLRLSLQFAVFALAQVLLFHQLELGGVARPHVFLLYLLWLPPSLGLGLLLTLAFAMGLVVDLFTQPLGGFAFAAVAVMGIRHYWLSTITPSVSLLNIGEEMDFDRQSTGWILTYLLPMTLLFELVYFTVADLGLNGYTLYKALLCSLYTGGVCFLLVILLYRRVPG